MASFADNDITAGWESVFGKESYRLQLREIADGYPDRKSIYVDYEDLDMYNTDFAVYVLDDPDHCLELAEKVVKEAMPPSWDAKNKVNVRIRKLPRDMKVGIRKLRAKHLGKLVAVDGLVKRVTKVAPKMTYALFRCARCGAEVWQEQDGMVLQEPLMCPNPNGNCNKQANRFILDEAQSIYIDTQKVDIQESPEGLKGGAQPERLTAYVNDDISGSVYPGNRITLNGIIRSAEKTERVKTTVFETYMDVVSIDLEQQEYDEIQITPEDEQNIKVMSKDPNLFDDIVKSISPTIYGMKEVKQAIALQLFGGCRKTMDDGSILRGDIHILLCGDPGVAKSQILRYMASLAPRGIYASGKSSSGAGLTAAAVKDDDGHFVLEAGALVLADKGLACIDELDKMSEEDRSSLHEAMESQRVSVAKAGITAALQCRCSMLAAANPKLGRFDDTDTIVNQIDLPPALMSRFDLIFVLTDHPNRDYDTKVTNHILSVQRRGEARQVGDDGTDVGGISVGDILEQTNGIKPAFTETELRKYVAYSKRIVPVMTDRAMEIIRENYLKIRLSSKDSKTVPITARQLEAYVRLSEASARMRLSPVVEEQDAERAVKLVVYYLSKIGMDEEGNFDSDLISTGIGTHERTNFSEILSIIKESGLGKEGMPEEDLISAAETQGISKKSLMEALRKLKSNGSVYNPHDGLWGVVGKG